MTYSEEINLPHWLLFLMTFLLVALHIRKKRRHDKTGKTDLTHIYFNWSLKALSYSDYVSYTYKAVFTTPCKTLSGPRDETSSQDKYWIFMDVQPEIFKVHTPLPPLPEIILDTQVLCKNIHLSSWQTSHYFQGHWVLKTYCKRSSFNRCINMSSKLTIKPTYHSCTMQFLTAQDKKKKRLKIRQSIPNWLQYIKVTIFYRSAWSHHLLKSFKLYWNCSVNSKSSYKHEKWGILS